MVTEGQSRDNSRQASLNAHYLDTAEAEASIKLRINFATERLYYDAIIARPLCIQFAITAMCLPAFCLIWATNLPWDFIWLFQVF